ncbi:fe-S cluster assembly factor HCF101, chloroplastic-like [Aristolochia californica]|uniref:fe-S cluster assembly factor HCF101, chloroplastic-like n=1 Tax=Aristolochia californica TaxID=171875 RepID=UPI0035DE614D
MALSQIIDPDFGTDIVSCGFVKDLHISEAIGKDSFRLELTTPACPIKDMISDLFLRFRKCYSLFKQKANEVLAELPWVRTVSMTMSAQSARPVFAGQLPMGLQTISSIKAVSSCGLKLNYIIVLNLNLKLNFNGKPTGNGDGDRAVGNADRGVAPTVHREGEEREAEKLYNKCSPSRALPQRSRGRGEGGWLTGGEGEERNAEREEKSSPREEGLPASPLPLNLRRRASRFPVLYNEG